MLTINCNAGLCNRLRVLLSGYYAAKLRGEEMRFIWIKNNACGADFPDLFENKEFTFLDKNPEILMERIVFGSNEEEGQKMFDILNLDFEDKIIESCYSLFTNKQFTFHQEYFKLSNDLFNTLKPIKYIQEEVSGFINKYFDTKIMGLHIRKGDFISYRPESEFNMVTFYEKMDRFLRINPCGKFFIATDDGAPNPWGKREIDKKVY